MIECESDFESRGFYCEDTRISKAYPGLHDAWKIKKPVDLGYLDYSTFEKRKAAFLFKGRRCRRGQSR